MTEGTSNSSNGMIVYYVYCELSKIFARLRRALEFLHFYAFSTASANVCTFTLLR